MLDLLDCDVGQIGMGFDRIISLGERSGRDGDDLLVLAFIVLHDKDAYRSGADYRAGNDGAGVGDQNVGRVAIAGEGVGMKP